MAKKKKHILSLEHEFDFDMIGLCTHHNDYRLAWAINNSLGWKLTKCDDDYIVTNRKGENISAHSTYEYNDDEERLEYILIKNKSEGQFLIHEKPAIDYFLFLCNNNSIELDELITRLKSVTSILAAYPFQPEEISSAENLVFN